MKRTLVAVVVVLFMCQVSLSQDPWKRKRTEFIAGFGTSHFFGDIGGYTQGENALGLKDIIIYQTRFNLNAGIRYKVSPSFSTRLCLTYANFHATDETGSNEERGLESFSSGFETSLLGEFYFIRNKVDNSYLYSKGYKTKFREMIQFIDLFGFTGVGGLAYSVNGNDALQAMGMNDGGYTLVIPLGLGVNMSNNSQYSLGIEFSRRFTLTDYLDGYTSQYSNSNDVYYFLSFIYTRKVRTSGKGWPVFLSKRKY